MFEIREWVQFDPTGRAYCPSCQQCKGRRPSQKSLAVLESGAYKCHAGCTPEEIRASLGQLKDPPTPSTQSESLIHLEQVNQRTERLLAATDKTSQQACQWLHRRGITADIIRHFHLGLIKNRSRDGILIPIPRDSQSLSYYPKVRIQPWNDQATWSQKGLPAMVYFTHNPPRAQRTYLCEGEWDAILLGWAMRTVNEVAVATFTCGCNVIPYASQLQRLPGQVIIFYDRDDPGQKGAEKLATHLGQSARIGLVPCPSPQPPRGWDMSDALNAGVTIQAIQTAARQAKGPASANLGHQQTKLSYEQCLDHLDEILQVEDTARQLWELNRLARQVDLSVSQLRKMHQICREASRPFSPMDVVDFLAQAPETRQWIIAGKIPRGSTIALIADGGTGKSRFSYDLAYAVASGKDWNGFHTTQGKVLIIQTDEPDVDFSASLKDANYSQFPRGLVQVETEWQFSQMAQLQRWIEETQPLLVIIDSFTSTNRATELEEKDTNYGACIYDLRNIANTFGCTFLILHHTNKLGESRGTTAIPDNVSEVWYLRQPRESDNLPTDQRIWNINKSRSSCSGKFLISYDLDTCTITYHGDHHGTPTGHGSLEGQLLNHFQQSPGIPYEVPELAQQFNSSVGHVRRLVKRLWRQGHVIEEVREVQIQSSQGGTTRKKVYRSPESNDQVLPSQSGQETKALDQISPQDDQVLPMQSAQGSQAPDHTSAEIREPPTLQIGDQVEIQKGCFTYRKVEVVGLPAHKPGWVEVKQKGWLITKEYQSSDLRLLQERITQ